MTHLRYGYTDSDSSNSDSESEPYGSDDSIADPPYNPLVVTEMPAEIQIIDIKELKLTFQNQIQYFSITGTGKTLEKQIFLIYILIYLR